LADKQVQVLVRRKAIVAKLCFPCERGGILMKEYNARTS